MAKKVPKKKKEACKKGSSRESGRSSDSDMSTVSECFRPEKSARKKGKRERSKKVKSLMKVS